MNYALGSYGAGCPSAVIAFGRGGPREAQLNEAGFPVFLGGPDKADTLQRFGQLDRLKEMADSCPLRFSSVVALPKTNSDAKLWQYYGLMDVFVHARKKGKSFGMVRSHAVRSITLNTPLREIRVIDFRTNNSKR